MALPHPASDHAQDLVDNTSETAGKTLGSFAGSFAPDDVKGEVITGAGGMLFQQFIAIVSLIVFAPQGADTLVNPADADSQDLVDNLSDNAGATLGKVGGSLVPDNVKDEVITGAGGMLFQQFIAIVSLIVFAPQGDDTLD
ncbi:hypothetical protein BYT27DRAFT_7263510 [Phlegmacium glaucopus]|nr:hypothetical protein BYT27DRAFT_7263510 [Phlegmacium glaucopus]